MSLWESEGQICEITLNLTLIDKLKLPRHYKFYKSVDSTGSITFIPNYFFKYLEGLTKTIDHYYLEICPMKTINCNFKRNESITIIITKFEQELLGFIWSARPQRHFIVPYVYPKKYRDLLRKPKTVPILVTSTMLVDFEGRHEYVRWNPTVVIIAGGSYFLKNNNKEWSTIKDYK